MNAMRSDRIQCGTVNRVDSLPSAHYSLGRPLAPVFALNAVEVEQHVNALMRLCRERKETGGVVTVVGDWLSEASLYTVLSLSATRLRRQGWTVQVCGSPFVMAEAPSRPATELAVLLGANAFDRPEVWLEVVPGQVNVLAGRAESADLLVQPARAAVTESIASPRLNALTEAWSQNSGNVVGDGMLLCALGIDLPRTFFGNAPAPEPFAAVWTTDDADTGWLSIPGVALARHALAPVLRGHSLERALARVADYTDLIRRLNHLLS